MEQPPSIDAFKLLQAAASGDPSGRVEGNARLRFNVAQAIAQERILFHYQPVVRAANPHFPAFFESLVRLRLPTGAILPARDFMPLVEAGPLGRAIDRLALTHALGMLAENPGLRLSINMSPLSMGDAGWLALLTKAARNGSGACGRLIIEITEDAAVANADQTIDFMDHVRATGCAFALDDFGAGATSFKYFRDFRFDVVKIDGSFVRGIHASRDSQVLVECLSAIARHFEMMTVAEQVENEADAAWLRKNGIDGLQGHLYGRPTPGFDLPRFDAGRRATG